MSAEAQIEPADSWGSRRRRVLALARKETRQVLRDPSSVALGLLLPVVLILLFGFGLSLDVRNVPIAIVLEDPSPEAADVAAEFRLSPYFDARVVTSMELAERLMFADAVDGIVRIRGDFVRQLARGAAEVQVVVRGTDANTARIIQRYARGALASWRGPAGSDARAAAADGVVVQQRLWFNEAAESRHFLVPGLIVMVMTLTGAFLTALVVAREWERGTFEALFVTPVQPGEILLGKTLPYFALGLLGLTLCVLAARFLFDVPLRGSLWVLLGASVLYLLVALGIGLVISSAVKSQFVASQLALVATFLPAMMLSGFLFDIRSMPEAVQSLTLLLPARYYVTLLQTIFLAGDIRAVVVPNAAVLAGMAVVLLALAVAITRKKLS